MQESLLTPALTDVIARTATPFVVLDEAIVAKNYRTVADAFGPSTRVFFALKANNHSLVIRVLDKLGSGFDVASAGEIKLLRDMGIEGSRIAFSNPVKIPGDISYAYEQGVRLFAIDTMDEVDKLVASAPGSEVYLRVTVDNTGSAWPLAGKFGVSRVDAVAIAVRAKERGLRPVGLTFHVGSQCETVDNWRRAIEECAHIWDDAAKAGISFDLLDVGGGLPAPYKKQVPTVHEIAEVVLPLVKEMMPGATRSIIEPGRYIVAEAGTFVASVIGVAVRGNEKKVTLDAGLFNGLMEAYEAFWYPVDVLTGRGDEGREEVTLIGPTCDSVDEIVRGIRLPKLKVGDKVVFHRAGAYTNSYESYNGFPFPHVRSLADRSVGA